MKNLSLLGSTGYIGTHALRVIKRNPEHYRVIALGAGKNIDLLVQQIQEFKPSFAAVKNSRLANELRTRLNKRTSTEILFGTEGYREIATLPEVHLTIAAMMGASGLLPTFSAIAAGKDIALANKEALVIAGALMMNEAENKGATIFPVDSEHCAIQQSIQGHSREDLRKIILTGSGGPFKDLSLERLAKATPMEALNHPTWNMGKKISIDSATMMNKGLEAIEAKWLFSVEMEQIEILLHPESIIHSMVEYLDGSIVAQLAPPDMSIPISYALSYPRHFKGDLPPLNLLEVGKLTFEKPDKKRFRCLELSLAAGKTGKSMPAVLSGANEIAVKAFLEGKIAFLQIPQVIEMTLEKHTVVSLESIDHAMETDQWAQSTAHTIVEKIASN